jgi:hypothetical protein
MALHQQFESGFVTLLRLTNQLAFVNSPVGCRFRARAGFLTGRARFLFNSWDVCHRFPVSFFFRSCLLRLPKGGWPQQAFHVVHYQFMLDSVLIYME